MKSYSFHADLTSKKDKKGTGKSILFLWRRNSIPFCFTLVEVNHTVLYCSAFVKYISQGVLKLFYFNHNDRYVHESFL